MKKATNIVFCIYLGFISYSILIFFYGTSGFFSMENLSRFRNRLNNNNTEIRNIHKDLTEQFESLRISRENIRLLSRKLGYFRENESIIKIIGYRTKNISYTIGKIMKRRPIPRPDDTLLRAAACCVVLISYILFSVVGSKNDN